MDAPRGHRRPRPRAGSSGRHWSTRCEPPAPSRGAGAPPRPARPRVHRQRRAGQRPISSSPAASATPRRQRRGAPTTSRGSSSTGFVVDNLPDGVSSRGRGRRAAVRRHVLLSGYRFRTDAACTCLRLAAHRRRGALGRAGRRAAVPPRPHVLPARRPPGDRRPAWAGTPTGARSSRRSCPSRWCSRTTTHWRSAPTRSSSGDNVVMPSLPACGGPPARGVGLRRRRVSGRRVPQGGRRLSLPDPRARRRALSAGHARGTRM